MTVSTLHASSLVFRRHFLVFKKTWITSVFWTVVEPLVNLAAIGFGLGAYISNIGDRPFVEFYFPGLLCASVMFASYFESTYGTYTKWTHSKIFRAMMYAPIRPKDILLAEIKHSVFKAFCGLVGICLVSSFFGFVDTKKIIFAIPVFVLLATFFSAFGLLVCSFAKNYDSFIYTTSGVVVPLSLISGIYFPIDSMPLPLRVLAFAFPLSHASELVKDLFWPGHESLWIFHTAMLVGLTALMMKWSFYRMTKKLQ